MFGSKCSHTTAETQVLVPEDATTWLYEHSGNKVLGKLKV